MASKTPNPHKVPQRQWRKWNEQERYVFDATYEAMKLNQFVFLHPQQDKLSARKWQTVAWNAAWTAADAAREYRKQHVTPKGRVTRAHGATASTPLH